MEDFQHARSQLLLSTGSAHSVHGMSHIDEQTGAAPRSPQALLDPPHYAESTIEASTGSIRQNLGPAGTAPLATGFVHIDEPTRRSLRHLQACLDPFLRFDVAVMSFFSRNTLEHYPPHILNAITNHGTGDGLPDTLEECAIFFIEGNFYAAMTFSSGAKTTVRCSSQGKASFELMYNSPWPERCPVDTETTAYRMILGVTVKHIKVTGVHLVTGPPIPILGSREHLFRQITYGSQGVLMIQDVTPAGPDFKPADSKFLTIMLQARAQTAAGVHDVTIFEDASSLLQVLRIPLAKVSYIKSKPDGESSSEDEPLVVEIGFSWGKHDAQVVAIIDFLRLPFYAFPNLDDLDVRSVSHASFRGEDFSRKKVFLARSTHAKYNSKFLADTSTAAVEFLHVEEIKAEMTDVMNAAPDLTFLGLPAEVRNIIYKYLIPSAGVRVIEASRENQAQQPNLYPQILRVCRQTYMEARSLVYQNVYLRIAPRQTRFGYTFIYCNDGVMETEAEEGTIMARTPDQTDNTNLETAPTVFFRGYGQALITISSFSPFVLSKITSLEIIMEDELDSYPFRDPQHAKTILAFAEDPSLAHLLEILATNRATPTPNLYREIKLFCRSYPKYWAHGRDNAKFVQRLAGLQAEELVIDGVSRSADGNHIVARTVRFLKEKMQVGVLGAGEEGVAGASRAPGEV